MPFSLSEANSRSAVQLKRISEIKLKIFTHFFRVLYTLAQDVHSLVRIALFQPKHFSENIFSAQACERDEEEERIVTFVYLLMTRLYFGIVSCFRLHLSYLLWGNILLRRVRTPLLINEIIPLFLARFNLRPNKTAR